MNILITGAKGFVGKNLTFSLKNIKEGKDRTQQGLNIDEIYLYDIDNTPADLDLYCAKADFVFNLAGVNRPKEQSEFMEGNFGFASLLLNTLKKHKNTCPVMLSSSIQASLTGRFAGSEYGKSKLAGEELFLKYAKETGSKVYIYRFPNLFGKWCRPNYNSAVATFCHNTANGLPITVSDSQIELELLYIDDLVKEMLNLLKGKVRYCEYSQTQAKPVENGKYCLIPKTHFVTLGEIVSLLDSFKTQPQTLLLPRIAADSFAKKLYSTYLSYLPKEKAIIPLNMNIDERGSFTELIKTVDSGQFSVNISKAGITKGQHWHHSKWELFIVVYGQALIKQRKIDSNEILEYKVSGEKIEAVYMLPGYTHSIENLSKETDLITLMWANEIFDLANPDTFGEKV